MNRFWKNASVVFFVLCAAQTAYAAEVVPSGECVGIKLYTDGLVVCDTAQVKARDGTLFDIAKGCDIRKGDIITGVNGSSAAGNDSITRALLKDPAHITLTVERGGEEHEVSVTPADTADGPKLGLWLRDSTAGMGTITCYVGDRFAALGHGICDVDTGNIMPAGHGIIQSASSFSVIKGKNGEPGAIRGEIGGEVLGRICENRENGLFGRAEPPDGAKAVETAPLDEVRTGAAVILADVDGEGVREYSIDIERVSDEPGCRDMVVRVTDPELIEKTGGIVQGMSGAPILQDGRLAGAVTHVFVNDPRSGYAISADDLLKDM